MARANSLISFTQICAALSHSIFVFIVVYWWRACHLPANGLQHTHTATLAIKHTGNRANRAFFAFLSRFNCSCCYYCVIVVARWSRETISIRFDSTTAVCSRDRCRCRQAYAARPGQTAFVYSFHTRQTDRKCCVSRLPHANKIKRNCYQTITTIKKINKRKRRKEKTE